LLTAIDATDQGLCRNGLGIGILAKMAFDPARDHGLRLIDAASVEPSTTRIGIRRNALFEVYL